MYKTIIFQVINLQAVLKDMNSPNFNYLEKEFPLLYNIGCQQNIIFILIQ